MRRFLQLALLAALPSGGVAAQTEGGGHLGHHSSTPEPSTGQASPPIQPTAVTPAPAGADPPAMPTATGGGCMGCMGGGPRPFYAALLDMPVLTPDARRFIEAEAERRIGEGTQAITAAQAQMHHALAGNDAAALGQATSSLREGVLLLESGTAARRAVAAEASPRQFALGWFRDQLAVPAIDAAPMVMGDGPWGLSWYHVTTMAALVAFLIATLLIQRARTRRIDALVDRLAPGTAGVPPIPAPPAAANPAAAKPPPPASGAPAPAAPSGAPKPATVPPSDAKQRPWSGTLRVSAIFEETPDVKTFRLEDPNNGAIPFTFLPGQFLTFVAQIDGKPIRRSYTIASSPAQRDYVEITVKREKLGAESRYLHDQVAVGDPLQVSGPAGVFTFTGDEADSIVLIGGGVGITPMMCVIRYLTDRGFPGDIFLLYGAAAPRDFIFREELHYLTKRHRNLHVSATMAHAEGTDWTGAVGFVSDAFILRAVPDIARRRVHLCGPPAMMEAVKATLLTLGVARDKIRTEAFGPAQGRAPPPGPDPGPAAGAAPPAAAPPGPEAAPPEPAAGAPPTATTQVEFSKTGKTGPLAPDQSVLEAAEAIGVAIDYSCRVGICGVCVVPLKSGAVTMAVEEGLPPEEKARGIILACQAKSIGNLVVEA